MPRLFTTLATTALTSWLIVSPALAFEPGGVQIKGNVEQNTTVRTAINAAVGARSQAGQSLGVIHGGVEIGGNVKQTVTARTAINAAVGARSKACQEIGSIGDNPACK
jgi:hypothetical protein